MFGHRVKCCRFELSFEFRILSVKKSGFVFAGNLIVNSLDNMALCIICGGNEGKMSVVGRKGLNSMIRRSSDKEEEELCRTLKSFINSKEKIYVHHSCRLDLNDFSQKNDTPEPK